MQIVTALAIWLIIWWLVLFIVLPWGIRGQAEDDNIVKGSEPGAPVKSAMWHKVGITTLISFVITALVIATIQFGWLDWRDFPFLPDVPEGYEN